MSGCRWCPLLPSEARAIVLEAARQGREHDLGAQCWYCRRTAWGMRELNLPLRLIAATAAGPRPIRDTKKAESVRG